MDITPKFLKKIAPPEVLNKVSAFCFLFIILCFPANIKTAQSLLGSPHTQQEPCTVGFADMVNFAEQWLAEDNGLNADLNTDGKVNFVDYGIFASYWLENCPPNWPLHTLQAIDRALFYAPPMETRPLIRWWWPGGDVNDSELCRELTAMYNAGFGGAEIQSFAVGLPDTVSSKVFTYGSPQWYENVSSVLAAAREYGMSIDLTLGSSWPPGGSHIDDAHSLKQLICSSKMVEGPSDLAESLPLPAEPLYYGLADSLLKIPNTFNPNKMHLIALQAVKYDTNQTPDGPPPTSAIPDLPPLPQTIYLEKNSTIDLIYSECFPSEDGRIHWQVPEGKWVIFAFYAGPTGTKPFYSADSNSLVLDHFDLNSIAAQLEAIVGNGEQYWADYFGNTLKSLFVDSPELRTELYWTDNFLNEFYNRRGYRLEPFLPVLFKPFQNDAYLKNVYTNVKPSFEIRDIGPRVRQDYDLTVSELMIEKFIDPITYWAGINNLKSRIQSHGGPADLLTAYGHTDIPETEGLFARGKTSFLKFVSSATHLYDRKIASSEILAFKNRNYMTTPSVIIREANKQFACGVNHLVLHGFPYHYEDGFLPPYWMPFCSVFLPAWNNIGTFSTHLNGEDPFWKFMPHINDYLARAQLLLQSGRPVVTLALYRGILTPTDDQSYDPNITKCLEENGYTFDYVNSEALVGKAEVADKSLRIGANAYKALIITDVNYIPVETAQRISEFAQNGLPIIFVGDIPEQCPGLFGYEVRNAFIKETFEQIFNASLATVRDSNQFQSDSVLFVSKVEDLGNALTEKYQIVPDVVADETCGIISYVHRKIGTSDYYFLRNSKNVPVNIWVYFANETRVPEILDLWTGVITPAAVYKQENGRTGVALHFDEESAVVIGFEKHQQLLHIEKSSLDSVKRNSDGALTGRAYVPGTYEVWYNNDNKVAIKVGQGLPLLDPINVSSWNLTAQGVDIYGNPVTCTLKLDKLQDWTCMPMLQFFSGKGTYTTQVQLDPNYLSLQRGLELDLGVVCDVAEVSVNGQRITQLITPPYRTDITNYVHSGTNQIEVVVTTTLRNRLVGFGLTGVGYYKPFELNTTLAPSGLLGLVNISPYYKVSLYGQTGFGQPPPLPFGLNVVPMNYPDYNEQDVINAIGEARKLTGNISLSWFWNNYKIGEIRDYNNMAPLVNEAKRQHLQITLQFLTFSAFGEPLVPFDPPSFSNPQVCQAFLNQVGLLAKLNVDYLVLGPELNFVQYFNPAEFNDFIGIYQEAYKIVKSISPETHVGTSYQYDFINETNDWSAISQIGPNQDFIGFTSYFGSTPQNFVVVYKTKFPLVEDVPSDYYAPIRREISPDIPIVITETAWSSFYDKGLENQVKFLDRLPSLMKDVNPVNVIWALQYDVSYYEDFLEGLNYIGLLERNGEPKPAWDEAIRLKDAGVYAPCFLNHVNRN